MALRGIETERERDKSIQLRQRAFFSLLLLFSVLANSGNICFLLNGKTMDGWVVGWAGVLAML